MPGRLAATCSFLRLVWFMHALVGGSSMNVDHDNEEASANNTLTESLQQVPSPVSSQQSPGANSTNQESNEASTGDAQQRTSSSDDTWNASNPTIVSSTSGNAMADLDNNTVNVNAPHSEEHPTPNSSVSKNNYPLLDTIFAIIGSIFEVVLPIVNIVYWYPSYAIKVRRWMEYLFGVQIIEAAVGDEGLYRALLLLKNPNLL